MGSGQGFKANKSNKSKKKICLFLNLLNFKLNNSMNYTPRVQQFELIKFDDVVVVC